MNSFNSSILTLISLESSNLDLDFEILHLKLNHFSHIYILWSNINKNKNKKTNEQSKITNYNLYHFVMLMRSSLKGVKDINDALGFCIGVSHLCFNMFQR